MLTESVVDSLPSVPAPASVPLTWPAVVFSAINVVVYLLFTAFARYQSRKEARQRRLDDMQHQQRMAEIMAVTGVKSPLTPPADAVGV
ncbi:hypothetical protein F0P96_04425 [Hymenobacter busanensis]|uniref:Uncharacterized protein n=1 Tax=Hymenobacter busanensis TaxID=2607656 RepID=A0AA88FQS9_9BACT|nr:hypothetical protein [Hymenobacter busanensis]KAA9339868.1 hypothetical protein F0P96_04425 [Hymenobacter busanensis]